MIMTFITSFVFLLSFLTSIFGKFCELFMYNNNVKISDLGLCFAFSILGDALFALRIALRALPNQLSDWNQNQVNPCTWSQVICDDKDFVTSL